MNKFTAEEIMIGFVHKSLAVRKWNELQNSYVYGVHDLIAEYLKNGLTPEDEKVIYVYFYFILFLTELKKGGGIQLDCSFFFVCYAITATLILRIFKR